MIILRVNYFLSQVEYLESIHFADEIVVAVAVVSLLSLFWSA